MEIDHDKLRSSRLKYIAGGAPGIFESRGVGRDQATSVDTGQAQQVSGAKLQGLDIPREGFSLATSPRYYRSLGQLHGVIGGSAFLAGSIIAGLVGKSGPGQLLGAVLFAGTAAALCFHHTIGQTGFRWRAFNPDAGYMRGALLGAAQGAIPLALASTFWSQCTAVAAVALFGAYAALRLIQSKRSLRYVIRDIEPRKGA